MAEIKCPKCGEVIQIGKDTYNALLSEIEQEELNKRVNDQVKLIEDKFNSDLKLKEKEAQTKKDKEVNALQNQIDVLQAKLDGNKNETELEVAKAKKEAESALAEKEQQIAVLKEQLKGSEKATELEVAKATKEVEQKLVEKSQEVVALQGQLKDAQNDSKESEQKLKEHYDFVLKAKDEEIQHWKEYRVGDSTKDIGESLEQYCKDAFDLIRANAYPNAYFEKDNEVAGGTKGDFIFKDYTDEDKENEIVSIMFEMKNQKEDGNTKNESHLKKLDSDRTKKGCEYAVLVSTLEPDSALYNAGIVDVSHKYDKMFVVRPQFFLTIIGLIKNMAKSRFEYKMQVIQYQRENVDVTNFEKTVRAVAQKISDDYANAESHYNEVEKMCDDMIKKLTDLKDAFRLGKKWIGAAQNQLPELEVRKLVKNNPTMAAKFEELKENKKDN